MAAAPAPEPSVDDDVVSFIDWSLINHAQLRASRVPERYDRKLYDKLVAQTFDAGDYFCLEQENTADETQYNVLTTCAVKETDADMIFLIDHSWTFRWRDAREHLLTIDGLLERMGRMMGVLGAGDDVNQRKKSVSQCTILDNVIQKLPLFAQTYSVHMADLNAEQRQPMWYVMDEFGSRINHSDTPNVRLVPFMDVALTNTTYTLMFPLNDIPDNVEVTRDYASSSDKRVRPYLMYPWNQTDFSERTAVPALPPLEYFTTARRPDTIKTATSDRSTKPTTTTQKMRVFADDDRFVSHLNKDKYELVPVPDQADVLWMREHVHEYDANGPMVNQFPGESVLTVKDLLAAAIRRAHQRETSASSTRDDMYPSWFPLTYNLQTDLPEFVACHQQKSLKNENNIWIVKPWNLARGLDQHITDDLSFIIRLADSGPKIVNEYVYDPVLFTRSDISSRVKFDIRYIVILKSLKPNIELMIYNKFWLRFANREFSLDNFSDYETHFTVNNYSDPDNLLQMTCDKFIAEFERQYPNSQWSSIQSDINSMIRKAVEMAASVPEPHALRPIENSRAMFGVDVLLKNGPNGNMEPVLLEFNFDPDCTRACEYYPKFADQVFDCMFRPNNEWTDAKDHFDVL